MTDSAAKTVTEIINVVALLASPLIALTVQRKLDDRREAQRRRFQLFRTLMTKRTARLDPAYVEALNLIDVEFQSKKVADKEVRRRWRILLDHLNTKQADNPGWLQRTDLLNSDLLAAIAQRLGFDFDEVYISRNAYRPVALVDIESEQNRLRKHLLEALEGKRKLSVAVTEQPFPNIKLPNSDL